MIDNEDVYYADATLDDRNLIDCGYEVDDYWGRNIGFDDPDPADDVDFELCCEVEFEAKLCDPITAVIPGEPGAFWE
jgi:hypothetical protein